MHLLQQERSQLVASRDLWIRWVCEQINDVSTELCCLDTSLSQTSGADHKLVGVESGREKCLQLSSLVLEEREPFGLLHEYAVPRGVEFLAQIVRDIVVQRHRHYYQVGLPLQTSRRKVLQFVVCPPAADARIHDLDAPPGSALEEALNEAREGRFERHLQRLHERVAQNQDSHGAFGL